MKKFKIMSFCILLIFIIGSILFFSNKNNKKEEKKEVNQVTETNNMVNNQTIYNNVQDKEEKFGDNKKSELPQIPGTKRIQGIIELNHDGRMFMFNGQHFGEFGFEMEEYTEAHIANNKQKCIDYITHIEHNADYIEEGDILICSRDSLKSKNNNSNEDNTFIVLKAKDYETMKREALNHEREFITTVGEYHDNDRTLYLKYSISDGDYQFPFAIKVNLAEDIKILGKLEKGITVKVEYKDVNVPLNELEIQTIEIVEY